MGAIEIIVAALASGAAASLKPMAEQVVKDAYAALKALVQRKYGGVDLAAVEKSPGVEAKREAVTRELAAAGAARDSELLEKASTLIEAVEKHAPDAAAAVGVDLRKVKAAALRIRDVDAGGPGVRVAESEFTGDIDISNVKAGRGGDPPKKV